MTSAKKKILITGGAGYIGSVLIRKLIQKGYIVRIADALLWTDKAISPLYSNPQFELLEGDLRQEDVQNKALEGISAVIHLAAIVGDPACKKEPELAEEVNWIASKSLFDKASDMKTERFIFASTCSNYGKMSDTDYHIDETGALNPISLYARLKVRFEKYLLESQSNHMSSTSLRFATAYGNSPRMRFDLTLNEFVKAAVLDEELVVYGESFWRPYCHVEDISQACICALEADKKLIENQVFNVGHTKENYQKKTIVELIKKRIPGMRLRFVHKDEDPRDYKVSFERIANILNFEPSKTLQDGIDEIIEHLRNGERVL